MSQRGSDVAEVATGLSNSLRRAGLVTSVSATLDFARALALVDVARPESVFYAGQACFCRSAEDGEIYAATFWAFFSSLRQTLPGGRLTTLPPTPTGSPPLRPAGAGDPGADRDGDGDDESIVTRVAYSASERLRAKDFSLMTDDERAEASRLIYALRRVSPTRPGRRATRSAGGAGALDVRATVRGALTHGGDPVTLSRRSRSRRPRPLVLVLDVSGSMDQYARAMLRFAHATVLAHPRVEVFTLGTRCTRVTRSLHWRDGDGALARVAAVAPDFEGGTRLGACLATFNQEFGLGGVARGAVVVVSSDGWDRGEPDELAEQMARLSRVANRVIWVNPLKVSPGYEPLARGMAAALPYVDDFVSGHSLAALEELARVMAR